MPQRGNDVLLSAKTRAKWAVRRDARILACNQRRTDERDHRHRHDGGADPAEPTSQVLAFGIRRFGLRRRMPAEHFGHAIGAAGGLDHHVAAEMRISLRLTRRANQEQILNIAAFVGTPAPNGRGIFVALLDADECAPGGRKPGADQYVVRAFAEDAAIAAHVGAIRAELVLTRGIEQSGQDNQNSGDHIHRRSPCHPREAAPTMAANPFILPQGCCDSSKYLRRIFTKFGLLCKSQAH